MYLFLYQVWWFFRLVAQCKTMIGYHCGTSCEASDFETSCNKARMSSFCQAFQASSLMYLFLDQVWWFFKLVAQCKLWLATTVAHLVKPATLKHHATKQDVIFLSSVSSVKLDVPFLDQVWWFFKLVGTVQTMIGHLCGTSCEASDFETSCSKARCHLFVKRFKRQAWCTFFLTKCGGSSSW